MLYSLKVDEEGIIVFKDFEELSIISSELEKMGLKEILIWENAIGFKSFNSSLLDAAREINSAETEDEFYQSLVNNTRFYYLEKLDDNTQSVERVMPTTSYLNYCNKIGFFIVGDSIYKVCKDVLLHTSLSNRSVFESTMYDNNNLLVENLGVIAFSYIQSPSENLKTTYGSIVNGERIYDPTGWRNDRYCRIKFTAYYEQNSYNNRYSAKVSALVYGKKKNIWGNYVEYETVLSQRNMTFNVEYRYVGGSYVPHYTDGVIPNYQSSEDELQHTGYCTLYTNVYSPTSTTPILFLAVTGEATHRGMNGNWTGTLE